MMRLSLLSLLGLVAALPDGPVRTLPTSWTYTISSLRGPGCPDFSSPPSNGYSTRLTFGQNTVDGSEIYYWFVAYPWLRVSLDDGKEASWCETELQYKEFKNLENTKEGDDYRLRLHKNGTKVISKYELEEGVKATLTAEYDTGEDDITDTVTYQGPSSSGQYAAEANSAVVGKSKLYKLPKCGSGKIKFRVDLSIKGKKGKTGYVASEVFNDKDGKKNYYGVQTGFSYDWEKCGK